MQFSIEWKEVLNNKQNIEQKLLNLHKRKKLNYIEKKDKRMEGNVHISRR